MGSSRRVASSDLFVFGTGVFTVVGLGFEIRPTDLPWFPGLGLPESRVRQALEELRNSLRQGRLA